MVHFEIRCSLVDIRYSTRGRSPPQPRHHGPRHQLGSVLLHEVLRVPIGNRNPPQGGKAEIDLPPPLSLLPEEGRCEGRTYRLRRAPPRLGPIDRPAGRAAGRPLGWIGGIAGSNPGTVSRTSVRPMYLSTSRIAMHSCRAMRVNARPRAPARAVRPTRCT